MARSTPATSELEIPGQPGVIRAVVPPIKVHLPLVVWPRRPRKIIFGTLSLLLFTPAAAWIAAFIAIFPGSHGAIPHIFVSMLPIAILYRAGQLNWLAACFIACLLNILEGIRLGPALYIDDLGFHDRRLNIAVRWSEVRKVEITFRGVELELRTPIRWNWFLFLYGLAGERWISGRGRMASRIVISTVGLTHDKYRLRQVMIALAARHDRSRPGHRHGSSSRHQQAALDGGGLPEVKSTFTRTSPTRR